MSAMLSSIPVPPMPEQLTLRLQAVIADEATRRSAGPTLSVSATSAASPAVAVPEADLEPAGAMIPGRPDLPERTSRARRQRPRVKAWTSSSLLRGLTAAAALVVLVGGGILLARGRGPVSHNTAGSAPVPHSNPARNRPSAAIVGSATTTPLRYHHDGEYVYANAVKSNADYTKASLPDGVRSEVKNTAQITRPSDTTAPGESVPSSAQQFSDVTISKLESCLSAVATGNLVLLVEVAHYLGQPATIIVLKPTSPANDVFDVIVVGQACGTSDHDVITRLTVPKQ